MAESHGCGGGKQKSGAGASQEWKQLPERDKSVPVGGFVNSYNYIFREIPSISFIVQHISRLPYQRIHLHANNPQLNLPNH
jgi:hypothetical protein